MKFAITKYEKVRDEKTGFLTNKVVPVIDMAVFRTREEAESRLGSYSLFRMDITHAGFRIREIPEPGDSVQPEVEVCPTCKRPLEK